MLVPTELCKRLTRQLATSQAKRLPLLGTQWPWRPLSRLPGYASFPSTSNIHNSYQNSVVHGEKSVPGNGHWMSKTASQTQTASTVPATQNAEGQLWDIARLPKTKVRQPENVSESKGWTQVFTELVGDRPGLQAATGDTSAPWQRQAFPEAWAAEETALGESSGYWTEECQGELRKSPASPGALQGKRYPR